MPATATTPAFSLHKVGRTFRLERHHIEVLTDVTLDIAEGSWTALVGRSGSGKTTLLQLLGALDRPNQGEISCRGRPTIFGSRSESVACSALARSS